MTPGPTPTNPSIAHPARDALGRVLDVPDDASPDEVAEAVARRDEVDAQNALALRRLGIVNGRGPGWA